jgi:hypothetical protein
MCPPESCCCCKLPLGVKIGAGLLIVWSLLLLVLVFVFPDESVDAFCDLEHLEATAECGEDCAVHESGTWFTADPNFHTFSKLTFPGYSGKIVPVLPLCSTGQGAQKTYTLLHGGGDGVTGVTAEEASALCTSSGMTLASIASANENEQARKACGDNSCWLGLESASPTKWMAPAEWEDGTSFEYANWWPVQQPAPRDDPVNPPIYVFMNVPGEEPGEHCTALTIHLWLGVLMLLVTCGLSVLALVGANSLDGTKLDPVWQANVVLWVVALIQGAVQTSQSIDLNPFAPPGILWGIWAVGEFCINTPLSVWWIISVRSLAGQCKDGSIATNGDSG